MNKTIDANVQSETHVESGTQLVEVIQAQSFQDLVGQVIGKLLDTVQHMEESLAHMLMDEAKDPGMLAGPQTQESEKISQDEVDDLFG